MVMVSSEKVRSIEMTASGRYWPVAANAGFSTWQPDMLVRPTGFGQKRPFADLMRRRVASDASRAQMSEKV